MMKKKVIVNKNTAQYMPLYNLRQLKSSITPFFGGDIKLDQHHYLLEPTTETDLFTNHMSRNIIFTIDNQMYFLNGNTHLQQKDDVSVTYDLMYQKVIRTNTLFKIETLSFIPLNDDVEILRVTIENTSDDPFEMDTITAIPIYARSADNIRDHRHVTSLLNRINIQDNTVLVSPTLSFDERGHTKNSHVYAVNAYNEHLKINRFITNLEDFIEGGSYTYPKGIYQKNLKPKDGYEAIAGIGFDKVVLKPGDSTTFTVLMGIFEDKQKSLDTIRKYQSKLHIDHAFHAMTEYFQNESEKLQFSMVSKDVEVLLRWVRVQPILRRIFGNSYLPHHDYGRGGRGWRDLWQDLLSLILLNDTSVEDALFDNFQGVRIDGSNATIIGNKPGDFVADRNKITRVWSDHGAWPLLTVLSFINTTGQIDFLFKKQAYFNDQFTHYTYRKKSDEPTSNVVMLDDRPYLGTVLEHLLLQNIVAHLNTGAAGFVKLENADWNDGLDMAKTHGETIAFTHFYASNLKKLADIIAMTTHPIYVFKSLNDLIFGDMSLNSFFDKVSDFKDEMVLVHQDKLVQRLLELYENRLNHIHKNAWIGKSHLQSYITDSQVFLDTDQTMNLTGQAMALLSETLTQIQAKQISEKTKELLFNGSIGGYHLNSNYNKVMSDMGRAFGFSYNNKENGAVFSHMSLMYVYGLYNYNLVDLGNEGYKALIHRAINPDSNTVLGIPEYFNEDGIGKYLYLTGSASWLLKLLQEQVFGLQFKLGKLHLEPKLSKDDFIDAKASIKTYVHGKLIKITYINAKNLPYGQYKIHKILCKRKEISLPNDTLTDDIEVYLDEM